VLQDGQGGKAAVGLAPAPTVRQLRLLRTGQLPFRFLVSAAELRLPSRQPDWMVWGKMRTKDLLLLTALLVPSLCAGIAWAQGVGGDSASPPNPAGQARTPRAGGVEDWNSLSLAGGPLQAEQPLLAEKDDYPQFTRELIQVKWRFGDPIDLYVIRPKGVAKPPAILYLYTYPSETDRFRNQQFCFDVTRGGFAAVGFVSALTGHRYKNRPMKEWFVSELQEALVTSVHDVQMILDYLDTRDDLDTSRIGMFGEGSGGTIAVLAAATDPRIKVIDLLDPWGDWPDWMAKSELIPQAERANYVKPEFLKKVAPLDPLGYLPQLKLRQVRIQQVMDDDFTPKIAKQQIESVAPRTAQLRQYDDTKEFFHAVSGGRLFQWMKDQIRPAPAPPPANAVSQRAQTTPAASEQVDSVARAPGTVTNK